MVKTRNQIAPPVRWVEEHEDWQEDLRNEFQTIAKSFENQKVQFYKKAIFSNLTLCVDDFVFVANQDSLDSDSIETADIAQILFMYEKVQLNAVKDRYCALIKWYTRAKDLKKSVVKDLDSFTLNLENEVIEDTRYGNDISIETIFAKCNVELVPTNVSLPTHKSSKKRPSFICRYKLSKKISKTYELLPIIVEPIVFVAVDTPSKKKKMVEATEDFSKLIHRRMSQETTPTKRLKSNTPIKSKLSPIRDEDEIGYSIVSTNSNDLKIKLRVTQSASKKTEFNTPSKRLSYAENDTPRRRSILKTPNAKTEGTPRKRVSMSAKLETQYEIEDNENTTPPKSKRKNYYYESDEETYTPRSRRNSRSAQSPAGKRTPKAKSLLRDFTIGQRPTPVKTDERALQVARERLHVSAVPKSLPCRDKEFNDIYSFLEGKLLDKCGGCMYVSGVPGTGKTATTTEVIRILQAAAENDDLPEFDFIDINGMRLTEPRQAYVHIYRQLSGKTISWEHAYNLLDKRFNTSSPKRKMTILLVDELDILCNKRQDVVYNILNWPTLSSAKLVVITIANTMDLPERLLMGKITSRLGLTRLTFQPYNFQQLQEILNARLSGTETFNKDAVQLVARKVAAVSGDARRALDICRRATEIAEAGQKAQGEIHVVSISDVQQALSEMIASAKIQAIKSCSKYEQIWLQAVCAEVQRTGVEECTFMGIFLQFESIIALNGLQNISTGQALGICSRLGAARLLITEHSRQDIYMKVLLNISSDDVHFALKPV